MTVAAGPSLREKVKAFLVSKPGEYVDGLALAKIGGAYAWRTRTSEARVELEAAGLGTIENLQTREGRITRSLYRFVPAAASGQRELF